VLSSVWQEEFEKKTALKRRMATEIRLNKSLSWVIGESTDSMTQIADELKSNDNDGAQCLEC